MSKMNPEVKQLWLDALRNGGFQQTRGALHDDKGYCCLGVLCEVAIKAGIEIEVKPPKHADERFYYDGYTTVPPDVVQAWANISETGHLDKAVEFAGPPSIALTALNDRGMTFDQIADVIEKQL